MWIFEVWITNGITDFIYIPIIISILFLALMFFPTSNPFTRLFWIIGIYITWALYIFIIRMGFL